MIWINGVFDFVFIAGAGSGFQNTDMALYYGPCVLVSRECRTDLTMVLILDDCSERDAHVRNNLCFWSVQGNWLDRKQLQIGSFCHKTHIFHHACALYFGWPSNICTMNLTKVLIHFPRERKFEKISNFGRSGI